MAFSKAAVLLAAAIGCAEAAVVPRISPELEPESSKKFNKDYPDDVRPSAKGLAFGHPYPVVQDSGAFASDFVKDENGDNGQWKAQMEYDTLRGKLRKEKAEAEKALKKKEEEMKELEEARTEEKQAEQNAAKANADAAKARAEADKASKEVDALDGKDSGGKKSGSDGKLDAAAAKVEKETADLEKCKKELEEAKAKLKKLMEEKEALEKKEAADSEAAAKHHADQTAAAKALAKQEKLEVEDARAKETKLESEEEQLRKEVAEEKEEVAEKKAADDDELPMPSFAVEQPMGAKVLHGAEERELGVPPALDLQHPNLLLNSSTCMSVRKSNLVGAGDGCFAACDIPGGTLLGEYKGKTYMTSGKVPNDGAYTWKVPACDDATTVLTREDTEAWATCGNRNGFVYVDAAELNEKADNPMRYVNGAWSKQQRMGVNVDAVINDRRVYYFTSKTVSIGDELVIDYGPQYWAKDSSPPPPSPAPPMLNPASAHSFAAANVASKYEKEADEEAHSILADANKLGARLRAAREKAKVEQSASNEDAWADEREVDQGLTK